MRIDQIAIIWTVIAVIVAAGFAAFEENSQYPANKTQEQSVDSLAESSLDASRGGIAQQAAVAVARTENVRAYTTAQNPNSQGSQAYVTAPNVASPSIAQTAPDNQPYVAGPSLALNPATLTTLTYPSITNITNPNPIPLLFTPNPPNIGPLRNVAGTGSSIEAVFYDKNSVCYGVISDRIESSDTTFRNTENNQMVERKLYKCDGTFVRNVNPHEGQFKPNEMPPRYWTFDTSGNLFFAYKSKIVKLDSNGNPSVFASQFARGLAIDSADNVYVADNGYQIHKYRKTGNLISTLSVYPEHNVPYYVQLTDSFDRGYVGVAANHWAGVLDRFPGYHNSPEYNRPRVDCDPNASIRSDDRPTVRTRGDYNVLTNAELRADSPSNYGTDGNIFGPNPCEIVIFVHGYNNDFFDARAKYDDVYAKLSNLGEQNLANNLILYSWDSDTGLAFTSENYHDAQSIGRSNGHALAAFISAYHSSHPKTKIFLMSHSMGAQVVLSALQKGATVDRLDMLAPAAEASTFLMDNIGSNLHNVRGGVYVHVNTSDDALEQAKNIGVVNNPLGLEGAPTTCNPGHFATTNINSVVVDSKDRLYAAIHDGMGSYVAQLDASSGAILYGKVESMHFDHCALTDGRYMPRESMLTTRGERLFVGSSISPQAGIYYDRTSPIIPDPRNYVVNPSEDPAQFIPPQAVDYDPFRNPVSIKETYCSTVQSTGQKILRLCEYADAAGNKTVYKFEVEEGSGVFKPVQSGAALKATKQK